ncbi:MAG: hypothetical protein ABSE82_11805 [Nitrososphaerales archaeon]|jgi:hypothetical protein
MPGLARYLRTNWGAPFVVAFIVLLVASAGLLSAGRSGTANNVAVYAFYALVLGVVLQVASYVTFGESEPEESVSYTPPSWAPPRSWRPGRRTLAVVIVAIVIVASFASVIYYKPSTTSHTTHTTIGHLSAGLNFIATTPGPNNSVQLTIGINETGGLAPYNFTAYWSDGVNQTNDVGVFIRTFLLNQSIPDSASVDVKSADGQVATVSVTIPSITRTTTSSTSISTTTKTTTSTTSSTSTTPSITFVESGLPSGTQWSVTLAGVVKSSTSNQIVFTVSSGSYNYTLSEPYNSNFTIVYKAATGTVVLGKANTQQAVSYSPIIVGTPENQLFILTSKQASTLSNGSEQFDLTYVNLFPVQIQADVVVTVKSNSTGLIAGEQSSTIAPMEDSEQSTVLLVSGLASGEYVASFYVVTPTGTVLSQIVLLNFTR